MPWKKMRTAWKRLNMGYTVLRMFLVCPLTRPVADAVHQSHLRIQNIWAATGSKEGIDDLSGHVTHANDVHRRLEVLVG